MPVVRTINPELRCLAIGRESTCISFLCCFYVTEAASISRTLLSERMRVKGLQLFGKLRAKASRSRNKMDCRR